MELRGGIPVLKNQDLILDRILLLTPKMDLSQKIFAFYDFHYYLYPFSKVLFLTKRLKNWPFKGPIKLTQDVPFWL